MDNINKASNKDKEGRIGMVLLNLASEELLDWGRDMLSEYSTKIFD